MQQNFKFATPRDILGTWDLKMEIKPAEIARQIGKDRPVFNIADSAISVGVFLILVFQKRFFKEKQTEKPKEERRSGDSSEDTAG